MTDDFHHLVNAAKREPAPSVELGGAGHAERKHAKFSASGFNRIRVCPGSVTLSSGIPDKSSPAAAEGTRAHEILEQLLCQAAATGAKRVGHITAEPPISREMMNHTQSAANFILDLHHKKHPGSDLLVESKVHLDFIHEDMWGTFDGAVVDYFGTLHVLDFKYGSHTVSPRDNTQLLFYAIGLAHRFSWNFKRVRHWIIQPRASGYDGPTFWEIQLMRLKGYVPLFRNAVERALKETTTYVKSDECFFCKAKGICPLQREARLEKARTVFTAVPVPE